jgi:hypothetical protein
MTRAPASARFERASKLPRARQDLGRSSFAQKAAATGPRGTWAEREHGIFDIDVENGGFDRFGLTAAWKAICLLPPPDVTSFVRELKRLG